MLDTNTEGFQANHIPGKLGMRGSGTIQTTAFYGGPPLEDGE